MVYCNIDTKEHWSYNIPGVELQTLLIPVYRSQCYTSVLIGTSIIITSLAPIHEWHLLELI